MVCPQPFPLNRMTMTNTTLEATDVEDGRDAPLTPDHSTLNCYIRKKYFCLIYSNHILGSLQYDISP